ncbi:ras and Rab interactor-like protein [Rhinatrema bivittatum]|uniref:ras and Rab interactor-like protein n=1 Tax=Rhinatrema bivittatum TaxID=194408 RepID=UPI00112844C0|nr:ras and Rab interactor-like protein [Rhinatrema bivittatum]
MTARSVWLKPGAPLSMSPHGEPESQEEGTSHPSSSHLNFLKDGGSRRRDKGADESQEEGLVDSPPARLTLLNRLLLTKRLWQPPSLSCEEAREVLRLQPAGTFLVRRSKETSVWLLSMALHPQNVDSAGRIQDFQIKEEQSVLFLENSCLGFRDVCHLIAFYVISRDVLPAPLRLPSAFLQATTRAELHAIARLGINFWTSPFSPISEVPAGEEMKGDTNSAGVTGQQICSIQVTSASGALCLINPLFLYEHGDGWLTRTPSSRAGSHDRSRATFRLKIRPSIKNDDMQWVSSQTAVDSETLDRDRVQAVESTQPPEEEEEEDSPFQGVGGDEKQDLLPASTRRKPLPQHPVQSLDEEMDPELLEHPGVMQEPLNGKQHPEHAQGDRREPQFPHRVSWIEGDNLMTCVLKKSRSESSLSSCDSFLLPPIPELDSLSISSTEEEGDSHTLLLVPRKKSPSTVLTDKVRHRLSAVGSAFSGLICLKKRVGNRIQDMSQESASYFGGRLKRFVGHMLKGSSRHLTSTEMLQEVRQMIANLKSYLAESSELHAMVEHADQEDFNLDATIEDALYKCLLKPLKECIYSHLLDFHSKDGTLRKLRDNQHTMKEQSLAELKVRAGVPDTGGMDKIQQNFGLMHAAYSPKKKVMQLLKVCKLIYEAMNHTAGKTEIYGADDFLPVLIYVLLGSDITSLQLDVEYMMELLDPTQLQGEGGYYLTTFFGALHHIANVQSTPVTGQMSKEAQRSIHQWQRRRTIHHSHGPRRSTQNVLFVSFQEPFNNEKTIIVPADTTTASVCALCSQKYQIQDSEAYGLFLVRNNELQLLDDNSCPQKVKVDFLKRGEGSLAFVYRLKDGKLTGRSASLSDLEGTRL